LTQAVSENDMGSQAGARAPGTPAAVQSAAGVKAIGVEERPAPTTAIWGLVVVIAVEVVWVAVLLLLALRIALG
jgi:hypothetical protein